MHCASVRKWQCCGAARQQAARQHDTRPCSSPSSLHVPRAVFLHDADDVLVQLGLQPELFLGELHLFISTNATWPLHYV